MQTGTEVSLKYAVLALSFCLQHWKFISFTIKYDKPRGDVPHWDGTQVNLPTSSYNPMAEFCAINMNPFISISSIICILHVEDVIRKREFQLVLS